MTPTPDDLDSLADAAMLRDNRAAARQLRLAAAALRPPNANAAYQLAVMRAAAAAPSLADDLASVIASFDPPARSYETYADARAAGHRRQGVVLLSGRYLASVFDTVATYGDNQECF